MTHNESNRYFTKSNDAESKKDCRQWQIVREFSLRWNPRQFSSTGNGLSVWWWTSICFWKGSKEIEMDMNIWRFPLNFNRQRTKNESFDFFYHFLQGMFIKSNPKAFPHVMKYLFTICDSLEFKKKFCWPIYNKAAEATFRYVNNNRWNFHSFHHSDVSFVCCFFVAAILHWSCWINWTPNMA